LTLFYIFPTFGAQPSNFQQKKFLTQNEEKHQGYSPWFLVKIGKNQM
jgi:hypothetical protein